MNQLKALVFLVVGLMLILAALLEFYLGYQFAAKAMHAEGEVTGLNYGGSHPQIEFMTEDKQRIGYAQNGLIFGYRVGDKVDVLYLPEAPRNATVNSIAAKWGFPSLFLIMGVVFVWVSRALKRAEKNKVT